MTLLSVLILFFPNKSQTFQFLEKTKEHHQQNLVSFWFRYVLRDTFLVQLFFYLASIQNTKKCIRYQSVVYLCYAIFLVYNGIAFNETFCSRNLIDTERKVPRSVSHYLMLSDTKTSQERWEFRLSSPTNPVSIMTCVYCYSVWEIYWTLTILKLCYKFMNELNKSDLFF